MEQQISYFRPVTTIKTQQPVVMNSYELPSIQLKQLNYFPYL